MDVFEMTTVIAIVSVAAWTIVSVARAFVDGKNRSGSLPSATEERLARIEHAVDAIAVEVERISEGQRFATRLLSEREGADRSRLGA